MTTTETTTERTAITPEEYEKVKEKLTELTGEYQEQIELMSREAKVLAVIRSQINIALELLATYEEDLKDVRSQ